MYKDDETRRGAKAIHDFVTRKPFYKLVRSPFAAAADPPDAVLTRQTGPVVILLSDVLSRTSCCYRCRRAKAFAGTTVDKAKEKLRQTIADGTFAPRAFESAAGAPIKTYPFRDTIGV